MSSVSQPAAQEPTQDAGPRSDLVALAAWLDAHGIDNESGERSGPFVMLKPAERNKIIAAIRNAAARIERLEASHRVALRCLSAAS